MLKKKILNNELTLGSWITLGNNGIAEILARAGFDWLVVDLEHSTISVDQAGELIRTIELSGVPSLVRLTSNDPCQIKRVMDAGARGIVVPMVNTPGEAIKAIKATRYPPIGSRGVGLARAQGYGHNFQDYLSWQSNISDGPIVIVQIEHIDAVSNLKDILSVTGVDAFIVGPYDLSCSMGIPGRFDEPEFKQTINQIISIGKASGVTSGVHVVEPDTSMLNEAITMGYKFIAYSVDMRMLDVSARRGVNSARLENA
jgi:2-keto-3-deoxy-L-rhamnonate aldolase RhmA